MTYDGDFISIASLEYIHWVLGMYFCLGFDPTSHHYPQLNTDCTESTTLPVIPSVKVSQNVPPLVRWSQKNMSDTIINGPHLGMKFYNLVHPCLP